MLLGSDVIDPEQWDNLWFGKCFQCAWIVRKSEHLDLRVFLKIFYAKSSSPSPSAREYSISWSSMQHQRRVELPVGLSRNTRVPVFYDQSRYRVKAQYRTWYTFGRLEMKEVQCEPTTIILLQSNYIRLTSFFELYLNVTNSWCVCEIFHKNMYCEKFSC